MNVSHNQSYRGLAVFIGHKKAYHIVARGLLLWSLVGKFLLIIYRSRSISFGRFSFWLCHCALCISSGFYKRRRIVHFGLLFHILLRVWEQGFLTFSMGEVKHSRHPVDVTVLTDVLHLVAVMLRLNLHHVTLHIRVVSYIV